MSNLSQVTSAILPQGNVSDIIKLQGISSEEQVSFFIKNTKTYAFCQRISFTIIRYLSNVSRKKNLFY